MTYEPGKLREDAARYDRMGERLDTDLMRAHADALEKLRMAEVALADLIELADSAMTQANADGGEYDRAEELREARAALAAIKGE